jgi:hypothetical protein
MTSVAGEDHCVIGFAEGDGGVGKKLIQEHVLRLED